MSRLANGSANAEGQNGGVVGDCGIGNIIDLHGLARPPDFDGQPGAMIERHLAVNLSKDRPELAGGHLGLSFLLRDILYLQDGFAPGIGITAAVQRHERPGLDLGNMKARLNGSAAVDNDQTLLVLTGKAVQHGGQSAFDFNIAQGCEGFQVGLLLISTILEILK